MTGFAMTGVAMSGVAMRRAAMLTALSLFGFAASAQQPFISYRGVVNAASFLAQGLPGGSIAQGSIFTIFGSNLGPSKAAQSSSYPLPNQLAGVSVSVTQGANTRAAIPIVVLNSQVSAIMPSDAALGQALIRVRYNNQTSNPAVVNVVPGSPGLFSVASTGFGPGIVQNYISAGNEPLNTTQATAEPGQVLILWGTGLGPVPYADSIAPTAGNLPAQVHVFVGNQPAAVQYSGRSPCCSGLDQVVFTVPQIAPTGCYVPIQITVNGVPSNAVTAAIGKAGAPCTDAFNPAGSAVRTGGDNGFVSAAHFDYLDDLGPNPPGDVTQDALFAELREDPGGATSFTPEYSLPPVGTCTVYSGSAFDSVLSTLIFAPQSRALDGGQAFQVSSSGGSASVGPVPGDSLLYGALLAENPAITGLPSSFFNFPGAFTFSMPGGADVQRAQVNGTTSTPLQWTTRDGLDTLTRSSGLTVSWTGGNSSTDVALVAVEANNDAANSAALALCLAPIAAGTFSLPPEILSSLPATPATAQRVPAWVIVGSETILNPAIFSAGGLKQGYLLPGYLAVKSVVVH
jgi:uncharacterized protein (TIGR03437 family)